MPEPDLVEIIGTDISVGIHGFRFPVSARHLVFKMDTRFRIEFPDLKGRLPPEPQTTGGLPITESRMAPGHKHWFIGSVNRWNNLESNFVHETNLQLLPVGIKPRSQLLSAAKLT